jgi:RNA polymerase sigma-70 factor (ECF subfamily)
MFPRVRTAAHTKPEKLVSPHAPGKALRFTSVYEDWFAEVVRWIPAMGGRPSDVEDIAQDTFLVVERKLDEFDGGNLGGWIYAITLRNVQNHRRLSWLRRLVLRPAHDVIFDAPDPALGPAEHLERQQLAAIADRALLKMSAKHRRAFVLFELEGYSGEEIAMLEDVSVATVWTRLHHARKAFVEHTQRHRREFE